MSAPLRRTMRGVTIKKNGTPYIRRVLEATVLIGLVVSLAGCYWTPPDGDGSLAIQISDPDRALSSVSSSAVATGPGGFGFFLITVAEDSLLRGGTAVVDSLMSQMEQRTTDTVSQARTAFLDSAASLDGFVSSYQFGVSFPGVQFQDSFITNNAEALGSSSFRGLRAGAEYLVIAEAYLVSGDSTIADRVAFTTVTIEAGQTQQVGLTLTEDRGAFEAFLRERYGYAKEEVTVNLSVALETTPSNSYGNVGPRGTIFNGENYFIPQTLYYDIIDADAPGGDFDFSTFVQGSQQWGFYVQWESVSQSPPPVLSDPFAALSLLNPDGTSVPSAVQGNRPELPSNGVATVPAGRRVRIIVTSVQNRAAVPPCCPSAGEVPVVGVSAAVTSEANVSVQMYEFVAGDAN